MMNKCGFSEKHWKYFLPLLTAVAIGTVLILTGCGGGGGTPPPAQTLTGTAAAGAPIIGTVNVRGRNGVVSYSAIESDGAYTVDVANLEAPYIVWASGSANGKSVTLYSACYEMGNVNVTPATDMALAMAIGDNPASYFAAPSAEAPDEADLDAAAQTVEDLMAMVFGTLGISGFDIMSAPFAADGTGFDELLDVVDMGVSEDDGSVQVVDTASETVLFQHDLGDALPEITPDQQNAVNDAVNASLSVLDQIRAFFDTVEQLYAGAEEPTLQQLQDALGGYMSADFLDDGLDAAQKLESWADPNTGDGPQLGDTVSHVAIARHMQSYTFGDSAPITVDEKRGNFDGLWATFTISVNGYAEVHSMAFVQETEGAAWKWAGDGNPFKDGGDADVRAIDEYGQINSGLSFYTEDEGNLAMDRGIVNLVILNPALPTYDDPISGNTYNCIIMARTAPEIPMWSIINTPAFGSHVYTETHGLDLGQLNDLEFVFVALDAGGTPSYVWVDRIAAAPIATSVLSANPDTYFPTVLTVGGVPAAGTIPESALTGDVTVTWQHPTGSGMIPDWAALALGTPTGNYRFGQDNPAYDDSGPDPYAWSATTLSVPYVGTLTWASAMVAYNDLQGRSFQRTHYLNVDQPLIEIDRCWLQYRTHTNSANAGFKGWMAFKTTQGDLIASGDINSITLSDPGNNPVPIQEIQYHYAEYDQMSWDEDAMTIVESGFKSYSGFQVKFPEGTDLAAGLYTFTAVTQAGQTLSTTYNFPGKVELPVIDVAAMSAGFNLDGDMILSWANPVDISLYHQLRLRLLDGDLSPNVMVFELKLTQTGKTLTEFIIPAEEIQEARNLREPNILRWSLQTRLVDGTGGHYARGQTSNVLIADW